MTKAVLAAFAAFSALAVSACAGDQPASPEGETAMTDSQPAANIRDVSIAEASALIASEGAGEAGVTVLDVRRPEEFADGHIAGAVNVNVMADDFVDQLADLDPDARYVLHCKSGARSAKALEVLKQRGFTNVAHMNEGFDGWQAAGQPVEQ